ncbi:MAG: SDH family Clp fold serine proteinase, partial [Phycisphaeraceae bacterium]
MISRSTLPMMRTLALLTLVISFLGLPLAAQEPQPPAESPAEQAEPAEPARASEQPAAALPSGADVAVIPVRGEIGGFTLTSIQRRVDRAIQSGASLIVFEIRTPGGVLTDALDIAKYIKSLPVPTAAWIDDYAFSAGILIASAADEIIMEPNSTTGDAAPILPGQEVAPTERAKVLSPLLAEFADNASANGYPYPALHAMAVLGVEVYLIEDPATGERTVVNQADYAVMVEGESLDDVAERIRDRRQQSPADIAVPGLEQATPESRGQWERVAPVHDGTTLLTLSPTKAKAIGLSSATIATEADLQKYFGASSITRVAPTWSERLAGLLSRPLVRGLLLVIALVAGYLELQSPGLGVPGTVAVVAVALLFGAPYVAGVAEIWHILLFFAGLAMLILELLFLPGFGLLGIAGVVTMFAGILLAGIGSLNQPADVLWDNVLESSVYLFTGLLLGFFGIALLTRYVGSLPILNRLVLENPPTAEEQLAMAGGTPPEPVVRPGSEGRVTTGLRPSGRAEFDDHELDVLSYGQWIEPGRRVRV